MAACTTPALAAAVSNAGALGSLGIGASTVAQARQMIEATQALTAGLINVNVFCHAPAQRDTAREAAWLAHLAPLFAETGIAVPSALDEIYRTFVDDEAMFRLLLELRPAAVSFHFGLPDVQWIAALRAAGIRTMAIASSCRLQGHHHDDAFILVSKTRDGSLIRRQGAAEIGRASCRERV